MMLQAPGYNPLNQPITYNDGTKVDYKMGQDVTAQTQAQIDAIRKMPFVGDKMADQMQQKLQQDGLVLKDGHWYTQDTRTTTYADGHNEVDSLGTKLRDTLKDRYTRSADDVVFNGGNGGGSPYFDNAPSAPESYNQFPSFAPWRHHHHRHSAHHARAQQLFECQQPAPAYWMNAPRFY